MAQHHHALNIPEVLFRIGRHLESPDDVVACSLVCKNFHTSFEPYLWMNIHIECFNAIQKWSLRSVEPLARFVSLGPRYWEMHQKELGRTARQDRHLQGLQRIAPWIRALTIWEHVIPGQLKLGDQCSGINTLSITGVPHNNLFDETYWDDCEALLKQNSACLRSLTLVSWGNRYGNPFAGQPLWRPLLACAQYTNLNTLRIRTSRVTIHGWEAFLGICQQLEVLELTDMDMEDVATLLSRSSGTGTTSHGHNSPSQIGYDLTNEEQVPTSATHTPSQGASSNWPTNTMATTSQRLPHLRRLILDEIDINCEHQLEQFIVHSPLLRTLIWNATFSQSCWERFCNNLAARTWPCLDWIEIKREDRPITSQEHTLLIQSAPQPLRRLDVNIRDLEEHTFNLYRERGHFRTLTNVNLARPMFTSLASSLGSSVIAVASKQVQEVLESCPMLERITAMTITAQDIIQGKPWACRRLKEFEVMINMESSGDNCAQEGKRTGIKYTKDYRTQCHQVFERLGQLKELTVLDMKLCDERRYPDLNVKFASPPLRLTMGLGHLSTLRKLEVIGYHGPQEIRLADMEWMLQHWKKLRRIIGGILSMRCSKTLEGVPDDRSRLVMKTLKAQQVQFHICRSFDKTVWRFSRGGELKIVYCSESEGESESESEVDDGAE
ncbi:hypothetical protein B0O80DRAFT_499702 [Mortierella sp. GBAus27b]|nr:hypothetical protein BGX31_008587 [Mortierella sp. GBA43]KAI8352410.1 hypothetical protein B0O80DRAFT_499702 [Mortierella sp. GBAus27b]